MPGSRDPGSSLQRRMGEGDGGAEAGPGPLTGEGKDQLKCGRDGRNKMEDKVEPVRDVMQEDHRPTE